MHPIAERLISGNKRALSRAISLLERDDALAAQIMREVHPHTGNGYTVGITGPPGAGKSTLIARLTQEYRSQGRSVGILAVDPSSPYSGGALLGDRIRMEGHYLDAGVFIRSMSTRGAHGGVPRIVKGVVRLLESSGKDVALVETVGVGQTELDVMGRGGHRRSGPGAGGGRRRPDPEGRPDGDCRRFRSLTRQTAPAPSR